MQEQHAFPFLREILPIPLRQRLRINQALGFLAAGALFAPLGLGRIAADAARPGYNLPIITE